MKKRYQFRGKTDIVWTKWFNIHEDSPRPQYQAKGSKLLCEYQDEEGNPVKPDCHYI